MGLPRNGIADSLVKSNNLKGKLDVLKFKFRCSLEYTLVFTDLFLLHVVASFDQEGYSCYFHDKMRLIFCLLCQ